MAITARLLAPLLMAAALAGCDQSSTTATRPAPAVAPATPAVASATPAVATLTRVEDASQVCMVTNQFMGTAQIPIEVQGKTYFGCCEMCKARLANEAETRTANDPVTGEPVDKATAVIGKEPSGKLHYFASADNLARFRAPGP